MNWYTVNKPSESGAYEKIYPLAPGFNPALLGEMLAEAIERWLNLFADDPISPLIAGDRTLGLNAWNRHPLPEEAKSGRKPNLDWYDRNATTE